MSFATMLPAVCLSITAKLDMASDLRWCQYVDHCREHLRETR
jgi:hypothetical protein